MSSQDRTETNISKDYAMEMMRGLGMHRDTDEFCDVTVVIDDNVEFKCHRVVLAASSEFFKALLSSGMKEDYERRVDLKGISEQTFSEVLDCIYKARNILTDENILSVWHAANQLAVLFLLKDCETFVKKIMSINNCFAIYQTSKLLDSKEITNLSWNFILRNFETLWKSEEILLLTASEMKQLVGSQDLVTKSEDEVIETILRWAAHKPDMHVSESLSMDSHAVNISTERSTSPLTYPEVEGTPEAEENYDPGLDKLSPNLQGNEEPTTDGVKEQQRQQDAEKQGLQTERLTKEGDKYPKDRETLLNRESFIPDLLEVSRLCHVSGRCMMETVWANSMIRANQRALDIVQEATGYQIQVDRHHDYCPSFAVHRNSSVMKNVVLAIQGKTNVTAQVLVFMTQNGDWYGLGDPNGEQVAAETNLVPYSAVCFDYNTYIYVGNQQTYVYISSINQWKTLPTLNATGSNPNLLSLGNNLYAVNNDDSHSIEMLNVKDAVDGTVQGHWSKIGTLSTTDLLISCTTTVADKILVFGSKEGEDETIVECFDTAALTCQRLHNISGPSTGMVSFRKGPDTFVLQKTGALWRVRSSQSPPFVEIKYETLLWDFYRELKGAILYKDELWLFGPSIPSNDMDKQWELTVPGVFKSIHNIFCNKDYKFFMHTVIPKKILTGSLKKVPTGAERAANASNSSTGIPKITGGVRRT